VSLPQFEYTFCMYGPILHLMHDISQMGIPKWRPICKPNPETRSRDYKFLNLKSRD